MGRITQRRQRTAPQQPVDLMIDRFRGMNIAISASQLDRNVSPEVLNVVLDDRQIIRGRDGYERVFDNIGNDGITGLHTYTTEAGEVQHLMTLGVFMYRWFTDGTAPTLISNEVENATTKFFNVNEKAYSINGQEYREYDGTDLQVVDPFIPIITLDGVANQDLNLITPQFKRGFVGDGTNQDFDMGFEDLDPRGANDEGLIRVEIDTAIGVDEFTEDDARVSVNRSTGVVTIDPAPSDGGGVVNVRIQAARTFVEADFPDLEGPFVPFRDRIVTNTQFSLFGGRNDTRVFLAGAPVLRNRVYYSDVARPNYFPENNFVDLGSNGVAVTGFSKQYDRLIVFKAPNRQDNTIYTINSDASEVRPLNDDVGCINAETIQSIENSPFFLSDKGVYELVNTEVRDERNVVHVSDAIDRNIDITGVNGILDAGSLTDYTSVDFDRKYFLFNKSTGIAWIYDYRYITAGLGEWFRWDNMFVSASIEIGGKLYFGDSRRGSIYTFNPNTSARNDLGEVIETSWKSKIFYFDTFTRYKLINRIFITLAPGVNERVSIFTRSDRNADFEVLQAELLSTALLNYAILNYATFTYGGNAFPQTFRYKIKQKKINNFQIELKNETANTNFAIIDCTIQVYIHGENKGR